MVTTSEGRKPLSRREITTVTTPDYADSTPFSLTISDCRVSRDDGYGVGDTDLAYWFGDTSYTIYRDTRIGSQDDRIQKSLWCKRRLTSKAILKLK